jgi:predicted ATPase/signal transduction histidine kinase
MNRSVDSRSDLYALGVTLYEMLTGTLPFTASDAMEWVHCHIARQPVPPSARVPGVPAQLSAIVMKLLAKTAEERYQTSAGLVFDLRQCLADWETTGHIDALSLGTHDTPDQLLIPENLYGREREIDTLLSAFERVVAQGTPELVLVSGYSGIGKSSVVHELHKALVPPRGLFASGKFDQYRRDIPYATLAQAFQGLVRWLLGQSEAELSRWRDALHDVLGANGQLVVNLIPEIELVIGKQPPVPELPPLETQNRFQLVLRQFIGVFAQPEHPLALFLDDLQWLDAATLDLLEHVITHSEVRYLLLVGAYRNNEVSHAHPLTRALEAIHTAGVPVNEIVLAPLELDDFGQLVSDALHCELERALPLAQLVHEKTGGNPFFAIQFFMALAEEGLLVFDPVMLKWHWNMDRFRARSYTDNVVDLMSGKLKRLPSSTQEALKQFACLGNVAKIATLALVHGKTEEAMHTILWEGIRAGLVFHEENTCKFLHDRIQQAAYSLIPEEQRENTHLHIGRVLLASTPAEQLDERLFDIANQLNRGAALLGDPKEKANVAMINLRAGRRARASGAYGSARTYFLAGMALLDQEYWNSHYKLMFSLWLDGAECELLSSNFEQAGEIIGTVLQRATSPVDQAEAYHLKIQLHSLLGEHRQAVDSALTCLRLFGMDLPAHPTFEQVQAEYEMIWQALDGRPVASLIELPIMTNPELQAAMKVLSIMNLPAYQTDQNLLDLHLCRIVNLSLQHGICGASAHGFGAFFVVLLRPVFRRYSDGYHFAKLACDLVDKHGFIAYRAKVYHALAYVAHWTQPLATVIDLVQASTRAAMATGDLTFACFGMFQTVTDLLLRNDPLDVVWRESEIALEYARAARFGDAVDTVISQQRLIANMQGRTATFSTFSDAEFEETTFEAQLIASGRTPIYWYWILKLKARFLSGDYAEALAAGDKVKPLLAGGAFQIQLLNYFYYMALTVAALYENASADEQAEWRDLLTANREQLGEWADSYPPTFADKHALVSAEIARLEGRTFDAMQLYEQAIQSARDHGFVQNEALAHEVAARFYAARGLETIAHAYLRNARYCYLRWGAVGKVEQLEQLNPQLREDTITQPATATMGAAMTQLDVETVVKASQALSSEMVLSNLIEKLMRIAVEHAGAERGLLILLRGDKPQIEAEAITGRDGIDVKVLQADVTSFALPQSALHYVMRTRDRVVLNDASNNSSDSEDVYVRQHHCRSVLCLPIIQQTKLIGALYLENNLTPHAFTSERVAVLEMLASQAAISLENARLYSDLQRSEAFLAEGQNISHTGSFGWNVSTGEIYWSEQTYQIFAFDPAVKPTVELIQQRTHPDDLTFVQKTLQRATQEERDFDLEHRLLMPDGTLKYVHVIAHFLQNSSGNAEFVGAVMDVTATRQSEEALRKAQADLAHVSRVTTVGELVASIAHEVNQPLGAIVTNGSACLRLLSNELPDLDRSRKAIERMINDGVRASEVIKRIRNLLHKSPAEKTRLSINETVQEVIALVSSDVLRSEVELRVNLAPDLPAVMGDRIQLQQVILNLILNARDAMSEVRTHPRELLITTLKNESGDVVVAVRDSGKGLDANDVEKIFDPFFTTKPEGMGLGLSISRTIIEDHHGTLWAKPNEDRGATILFSLPTGSVADLAHAHSARAKSF